MSYQPHDSLPEEIRASGLKSDMDDSFHVSEQLELLSEMGKDFADSGDINASLDRGLKHIVDYVNAEGGALFVLNKSGESLRCDSCFGATDITGITLKSDQGIVGRSVQTNTAEIVRDAQNDPSFHKGIDEETGFTTLSIICAPMEVKGEKIGAIELINKRGGDGLFDESDLRLLKVMAASAAMAIINARMAKALITQERLARELELAATIQRSLLPDEDVINPYVYGINIPARTVSGDFFDYFQLKGDRVRFNIGDVSGKGMNAALMMAKTTSLYRCLGKTIDQPGRVLARINAEICETATHGMFVTLVGGLYDPNTGIVNLSNAGHEPPLYRSPEGKFDFFEAQVPPVGIVPLAKDDEMFPELEIDLKGGALYIYTDGVTEGYLENGEELGVEGVKEFLNDNDHMNVRERLDLLVSKLNWGGEELRDDLTILVIDDAKAFEMRHKTIKGEVPLTKETDRELVFQLKILSRPDRLKLVRKAVYNTAIFCGCGDGLANDLVIAVDEALQNIIRHAYHHATDGEIEINIYRLEGTITFEIRDYADPIDLTAVQERDVNDIRPGGLGVHFMREVMDEVAFLTSKGARGNLLKMSKNYMEH